MLSKLATLAALTQGATAIQVQDNTASIQDLAQTEETTEQISSGGSKDMYSRQKPRMNRSNSRFGGPQKPHQCADAVKMNSNQRHPVQQWNQAQQAWKSGKRVFQDNSWFGSDAMWWERYPDRGSATTQEAYTPSPDRGGVNGWKRMTDFKGQGRASLYGQGVRPEGVGQGSLGTCFFLAAVSALAENPGRIKALIQNSEYPANGVFMVHYFVDGEPLAVTIDDRVPFRVKQGCNTGPRPNVCYLNGTWAEVPINSQMSPTKGWWMPVLEKAYAKLHGTYDRVNGGFAFLALRDMSGVPVMNYGAREMQRMRESGLWNIIKKNDDAGNTMTTSCCQQKYGKLYSGHAYTLLGAVQVNTHSGPVKLVKIRNPHAAETYVGEWCDKCREWTPDYRRQAKMTNKNDGIFHIPIDKYIRVFKNFSIAHFEKFQMAKVKSNKKMFKSVFSFTAPASGELFVTAEGMGQFYYARNCKSPQQKANLRFDVSQGRQQVVPQFGLRWGQYYGHSFQARSGQTYHFNVYKFGGAGVDSPYTLQTYMKEGRATLKYDASRSTRNNGW